MTVTVEETLRPFGAIVKGWVPAEPLGQSTVNEIKKALAKFHVLILRGHLSPTDGQLVNFAQHFGELIRGSAYFGDNQEYPEILRVNNLKDKQGYPLGTGGAEACDWHSDYTYMKRHGVISFLDAVTVPNSGGQTYFANTYSVVESLEQRELCTLADLTAYHDTLAADRNVRVDEARKKVARAGTALPVKPNASHPMIISNPDTGRDALFVSPMLTRYIRGISSEESHALLENLFESITRAENVYGHEWEAGDLVMWDNIGLIHRRDAFDPHEIRVMRQLTTLSTEPKPSHQAT